MWIPWTAVARTSLPYSTIGLPSMVGVVVRER
jgi:hypothetical protein